VKDRSDLDAGQICRWCHEGEYEWQAPDNCSCHIASPCGACSSDDLLRCDVCGEAAITFEEAEACRKAEGKPLLGIYT